MIHPCHQCPRLTGSDCRPVPSCGPRPARLLFIGAGPGKTENQTLIPYSGLAGDELSQTYLGVARLRRDEVAIGNASMCWDGSDKISDKRVAGCAAFHLPAVLDAVRPEVVVLMGGVVQQLSDTRVRLDMQHGRPFRGTLLDGQWEGWVVPMYEPALGMRETSRMTQLLEDFRDLGRWLRGEWLPPNLSAPDYCTDYRLVGETDNDLNAFEWYLRLTGMNSLRRDDWRRCPPFDTERHGPAPWSVQLSVAAHTGRMVMAGNKRGLEVLAKWVYDRRVQLHNAGQDQDILDKLGVRPGMVIELPSDRFIDTMQEAFQLCSVPQGLKPLAYRLLGVTMRSWEDVVWPASVEAVVGWMRKAQAMAQESFQDCEVFTFKRPRCRTCGHQHTTGKCKTKVPVNAQDLSEFTSEVASLGLDVPVGDLSGVTRPCGCESTDFYTERIERKAGAVESILTHVTRYTLSTADADDPYNPWEALDRMKVEGLRGRKAEGWQWEAVEEEIGPVPILGIGNVDLPEAVRYGCADADMTGQVSSVLAEMRGSDRWKVDRSDWDV